MSNLTFRRVPVLSEHPNQTSLPQDPAFFDGEDQRLRLKAGSAQSRRAFKAASDEARDQARGAVPPTSAPVPDRNICPYRCSLNQEAPCLWPCHGANCHHSCQHAEL